MKKGVIFCVDDEKIVLNAIKSELKHSFGDQYIIETAENGQEALDTIDELLATGFQIPLIISDYAMPVIKGDELLTLTHKRTPQSLSILLTGQATVEGVANAINKANLYRYIAKPWETSDLILTVEQALISYNQQNQLELQNKELRELSESLELKVEERTSELKSMNILLLEKQKEIITQNYELEKHRNHLESLIEERTVELIVAKEKAEENDRLKTAFMLNISHEIRTPMNGILGFIELLRNPLPEKLQTEYLDIIDRCGRQLVEVITDIVEISRLETKQVTTKLTHCDNLSLANSINAIFRNVFDQNTNVKFCISGFDKNFAFLTDIIKIKQILTNLINNAVKNTQNGSIELGCRIESENILFFVKDTGIGISKEYHEIIFDRFRQVDSGLTRIQEGTGLGLSISKAYVELLGGKIWLESEPNIGSTFIFTIPYMPLDIENIPSINEMDDLTQVYQNAKILVVEDEDNNFILADIILTNHKFKVLRAKNGEEAVNICKSNPDIDLVLMDIKMPVMNGYIATRKILEFRKGLPIIAQTAYAFPDDKLAAMECGCIDYIAKPLEKKALLKIVRDHLKK